MAHDPSRPLGPHFMLPPSGHRDGTAGKKGKLSGSFIAVRGEGWMFVCDTAVLILQLQLYVASIFEAVRDVHN